MTLQEVGCVSKLNIFTSIALKFSIPLAARPLAWWFCELDSNRRHRYLSIVSAVNGQAKIFELA